MKKKESLVTIVQFNHGLARLEGKLGKRVGGVEIRKAAGPLV